MADVFREPRRPDRDPMFEQRQRCCRAADSARRILRTEHDIRAGPRTSPELHRGGCGGSNCVKRVHGKPAGQPSDRRRHLVVSEWNKVLL